MAGPSSDEVSYCSSLREAVWHDLKEPRSFESWHFDATSDDGAEALAITFYDNYVLSPRFHGTAADGSVALPGRRYPAVSLAYAVDGKIVLDLVNEFDDTSFRGSVERPECTFASSGFRYQQADYGHGFLVTIDLDLGRGRALEAEIEWLQIEADLQRLGDETARSVWDFVMPRADVTGKLTLRSGPKLERVFNFRGTGYHDHILSRQVLYRDLDSRMWGRAHFSDSTVIFERHGGVRDPSAPGRFFVIRDGEIVHHDSSCQASGHKRDRWGLLVPDDVWFRSKAGAMVRVKPLTPISSGLYETRMLSEIRLGLEDGRERRSIGLTEFVNPQRLKSGLFRWVGGLGIRRAEEHATEDG